VLIDIIPRLLVGGTLAGFAAGRAARRGQLTRGGMYAAFGVGTAAAIGGIGWAVALAVFFYSSMFFSRWRARDKRHRSRNVLPDARARTAWQVLANGGPFGLAAIGWALFGWWQAGLFAFGALATATADTWATEIGMALDATPRAMLTGRRVVPGTSGGVSVYGTAAAVGAAFVVSLCAVASITTPFDVSRLDGSLLEAVFVGGIAGTFADSLLGATVQSRRWCERCEAWTERRVHTCGAPSRHRTGIRWITNDVVNLLSGLVGGLAALGAW